MKKLLIGLAIGFAVLVLAGVVALVAGGIWLKGKVEGVAEEAQAFAAEAEKSEARLAALNDRYPFAAPPKGVPVTLAEGRLQEYLGVRAALQPVFRTYEAKAKELEVSAGEQADLGDAMKAMGHLAGFLSTLRTTWLDRLEAAKMAPKEFHAISAALYTSNFGAAMGDIARQQRPAFEEMKRSLEAQLASAGPEGKEALEAQLASVDEQLAKLPPADAAPSEATKVHQANAQLYSKYKTQIEEQAAHGLDVLLAGGDTSLAEAFEGVGYGDQAPEPQADEEE